jgi:hypothetical protein
MKELVIVGRGEEHILYNSENELYRALKKSREEIRLDAIIENFRGREGQRGALNLGGIFGSRSSSAPANPGYPSMLVLEQGDTAFNTAAKVVAITNAMSNGGTARIWEFSVPPRYQYAWGRGVKGLSDAQGYWWFALLEKTVGFIVGTVTLGVESYNRFTKKVAESKIDTMLHSTTNTTAALAALIDKRQMQELPETVYLAAPYSRLYIDYTMIVQDTDSDADDCAFNIPVTVYS